MGFMDMCKVKEGVEVREEVWVWVWVGKEGDGHLGCTSRVYRLRRRGVR